MRVTVGTQIATGVLLVLAVLAAAGLLAYRGTAEVIEAGNARAHAARVIASGDALRLAVRGAGLNLRSYIISGDAQQLSLLRGALADTMAPQGPVARVRALSTGTAQVDVADSLANLVRRYAEEVGSIAQIRATAGLGPAVEALNSEKTRTLLAEFSRMLEVMDRQQDEAMRQSAQQAEGAGQDALLLVVATTSAGLLVAALSWFLITRSIARPLRVLTEVTQQMSLGNLDVAFPTYRTNKEIDLLTRALSEMAASLKAMATTAGDIAAGKLRATVRPLSPGDLLGQAFSRMASDLRSQIAELINAAATLRTSATDIAASTSQLAASASQSAVAVNETIATVEEVRQTAELASQKARHVSDSAQRAVQISENGRTSTQDVEQGLLRIRRQMELIATSMVRLSEQSQAVGQIIATVEDIATQSNLLAVNAAIEAAKAGTHGAGFGVVAQEVKSLAEQSRQATSQVRGILGDIQKATASAVLATEEGSKAVEAGIQEGEVAGRAIDALAASVNESAQAALQIVASSQQQLMGVDQVAGAMESIRQASAQNVASSTQLDVTARRLNNLNQQMKDMVARYEV